MLIDHSAPRSEYFLGLQDALKQAGLAEPVLVIDGDRLDANLSFLHSDVPSELAIRLVSKSLPCLALLRRARSALGTDRLMTFNLPMLVELAKAMPDADQMLGKPLPVAAAASFLREDLPPEAVGRVRWLVDTAKRLTEYEALGAELDRPLLIVLELDVGLHRGGFEPGPLLAETLERIRRSDALRFAGFMGYEAHLAKVPTIGGWRDRQVSGVQALYAQANRMATDILGDRVWQKQGLESAEGGAVRNAAGSPTYRFYRDGSVADEIAIGSALVKPTDFDLDLLAPYRPALFVATPALKVLKGTQIPVLEVLDRLKRLLNPDLAQTVFIHGGYWKAEPVDPPGLRTNPTYGRSTNQEMLNLGRRAKIEADDFVFLRPTQSESVMLQFGTIAVYSQGAIQETWSAMPASA